MVAAYEQLSGENDFDYSSSEGFGARWWKRVSRGPKDPSDPSLTRWAETAQTYPYELLRSSPIILAYAVTIVPLLVWSLLVSVLTSHSLCAYPAIDNQEATFLRCTDAIGFWAGPNAICGIDGKKCIGQYPIGAEFRFKCPANCRRESWTYTPRPVGSEIAYHEPFLVGSDNNYRADSFVCAAALHHGIISDKTGGCGTLRFEGPQPYFAAERKHSIQSFEFDSPFLASYSFLEQEQENRGCKDRRGSIIALSFLTLLVIGYWSVEPGIFVAATTLIGFGTVIFASNPPWNGGTRQLNAEVMSLAARRLLPLTLSMYTIYKLAIKRALASDQNLTRTIFWVCPFFCGVIENYVFGLIPIDRLTLSDLNGQAGAWTAFAIIVVIVLAIIFGQAVIIWNAGKFVPYLIGYLAIIPVLVFLGHMDMQTLRIHHYILALIFLPGTNFQTHASLVYNGLLTGLFVAGVSRWDFDSVIQTYDQLRRGAPEEFTGNPAFLEPIFEGANTILRWLPLSASNVPDDPVWNGFSLVINDVEAWRGTSTSFNLSAWIESHAYQSTNYYVRVAIANVFGDRTGRFTMAGIVSDGDWTPPEPGYT